MTDAARQTRHNVGHYARTLSTNKCSLMWPASNLSTRAAHSVNSGKFTIRANYSIGKSEPPSQPKCGCVFSPRRHARRRARESVRHHGDLRRGRQALGYMVSGRANAHRGDGIMPASLPNSTRWTDSNKDPSLQTHMWQACHRHSSAHDNCLPQSAGDVVHSIYFRARELLQHASLPQPSQCANLGLQKTIARRLVMSVCGAGKRATPT